MAHANSDVRLTIDDYPKWHLKERTEDLTDPSLRRWYEVNVQSAKSTLEQHSFSAEMTKVLASVSESGTLSRGHQSGLVFATKPFDSVIDKLYRLNCNWNRKFPNAPSQGWHLCSGVFERMDDLVRTLIVCRYIDGPESICQKIVECAQAAGLTAVVSPKATDEGYYAQHAIIKYPFELFQNTGKAKKIIALAEIQVTTQMQDALRDMTHVYYKRRRVQPQSAKAVASRWNFKSEEFRAAYLGHTLHLIEGIVAEFREDKNTLSRAEVEKQNKGDVE